MTSKTPVTILRFILLLLAQVLVFNRLNLFDTINPFVYVLFLYWYPIKENRTLFLGASFLLGFAVDLFSDTLAFHAAATVTAAYLRPLLMRFVFGVNYEFQSFKLMSATRVQQITFLALLIVVHHVVFFSLEIFSFSNLLLILRKTATTFMTTMVICLLLRSLFSTERE